MEKNRIERAAELGDQKGNIDMAGGQTTIKVPTSGNFWKLAKGMGYKAFLAHLATMNGPEVPRGVAEAEWKKLVNKLFLEWNPNVRFETREEVEAQLEWALNQVTHSVHDLITNIDF
jgi:hypothetical protein